MECRFCGTLFYSLDKTFIYEYNNNGNLVKIKQYSYTTATTPSGTPTEKVFTYSTAYADKLTNADGESISYNAMGYPTAYDGYTTSWTNGRLTQLSVGTLATGKTTYSYTYNALGQRTKRSYSRGLSLQGGTAVILGELLSSQKTFAYDASGRLIAENTHCTYHREEDDDTKVVYLYDDSGVIGMVYTYNGSTQTFYFRKNLLGDILAIYNTNGNKVVGYNYDAFGNCEISSDTTSYSVANANSFRYRGYYYDSDTGLYYLNSRYYSPTWRRFISPDNASAINSDAVNGLNLYTYASNNPVGIAYSSSGGSGRVANTSSNQSINLITLQNLRPLVNKSSSGIHWKNEYSTTNLPSFFIFSKTKGALLDWGLSVYKGSLYFNEAENHSIYIGVGNASAFIGYNVEKRKFGVFADAYLFSVGYDGRYVDAGISLVGIGFIFGLENKKLRIKLDPPGTPGIDISIDIGQIIKDVFGWEW